LSETEKKGLKKPGTHRYFSRRRKTKKGKRGERKEGIEHEEQRQFLPVIQKKIEDWGGERYLFRVEQGGKRTNHKTVPPNS